MCMALFASCYGVVVVFSIGFVLGFKIYLFIFITFSLFCVMLGVYFLGERVICFKFWFKDITENITNHHIVFHY